ncbi:peptidase family M50-domain-containing protein [Entophlyctis helioformis]|nr:peptidase family M50-domain-containing protein [Entophlyctis helioformis]
MPRLPLTASWAWPCAASDSASAASAASAAISALFVAALALSFSSQLSSPCTAGPVPGLLPLAPLAPPAPPSPGARPLPASPLAVALIPGWNLSLAGTAYLLLSLLVSAVFHELGHALCAASAGIRLRSAGIALFLIWPSAFVVLDPASLAASSTLTRLRVACGGIWHNIVLATTAWCLLAHLSLLLAPAYTDSRRSGGGVVVVHVLGSHPLASVLRPGDTIVAINSAPVRDIAAYVALLHDVSAPPSMHTHVPPSHAILASSSHLWGKCTLPQDLSPPLSAACCQALEHDPTTTTTTTQPPPPPCLWNIEALQSPDTRPMRCARLHPGFFESEWPCGRAADCPRPDMACMAPRLTHPATRILQLALRSQSQSQSQSHSLPSAFQITWVGDPRDLVSLVLVSTHVPKHSWSSVWTPVVLETLLRYLVSINAGLAVLNAVPAFGLDGSHILAHLCTWASMRLPSHSSLVRATRVAIETCSAIALVAFAAHTLWHTLVP